MSAIDAFANTLVRVIVNPLIALLFAVALLLFVWGLVQFLYQLNTGGKDTKAGKQHMFWGVAGMFIMVTAWGIFQLIQNTVRSI